MRRKHNQKARSNNSIRIIGGQWRGRKLPVISEDGLRPTGDRVRETLFNWLMPWINGADVLDMFSGSGALGFEALSRGARHAYMYELNPKAFKLLKENAALLSANCTQFNMDVLSGIEQKIAPCSIDVVFLDPPFSLDLWDKAFSLIISKLKPRALVYVEYPKGGVVNPPDDLELIKSKTAGQVVYQLYQMKV